MDDNSEYLIPWSLCNKLTRTNTHDHSSLAESASQNLPDPFPLLKGWVWDKTTLWFVCYTAWDHVHTSYRIQKHPLQSIPTPSNPNAPPSNSLHAPLHAPIQFKSQYLSHSPLALLTSHMRALRSIKGGVYSRGVVRPLPTCLEFWLTRCL